VGQRSPTETIAGLLQAFLQQRTWKQADLARHLELTTPAVRKRLGELQSAGVPLEREEDHPHIFWSVPKGWFPGGLVFERSEVPELLRLLGRLPRSKAREKLLATIVSRIQSAPGTKGGPIVTPEASPREEQHLAAIEDAASAHVPLRFQYYAASTGKESLRHASVHRVFPGPPARFVATCHRSGTLKWFRADGVSDAKLDERTPYREAEASAVDAFVAESLAGYHDAGRAQVLSFRVRDPEARWVARNLLGGMASQDVDGGIRVTVRTAGVSLVARYVVALGEAAEPETETLVRAVEAIATGALASARRARSSAAE
jgi:predicted DNA-binding transcriptional regulator YafY